MQNFDVIIVGASFAGLACAKSAASAGLSVAVLERKSACSEKIHTTGIIVKEALTELNPPAHLCREISKVHLFSPSLKELKLESSTYIFCATDTGALLDHFAVEAQAAGVQIFFNKGFTSGVENGGGAESRAAVIVNDGEFSCRFLVGADGPTSKVAKAFGLGENRQFLLGAEIEIEYSRHFDPDGFYCFLDQKLAPGYLAWIVPGKPYIQVGLASRLPRSPRIPEFLEHIAPVVDLRNAEVKTRRGGLIPVGGMVSPFYSKRVLLIGDASGVVSPLTAGGIHPAVRYGRISGELIAAHLRGSEHPGPALRRVLPQFRVKHLLKQCFHSLTPNFLLDGVLKTSLFRRAASHIFFNEKKLK